MIRFFLGVCQRKSQKQARDGCVRFPSLHGCHGHFDVAIIAIDLFLKVFFALVEVLQRFCHISYLLLTLEAHTMFAADVVSNGV